MPNPMFGICIPFVDPCLSASDAPLCWCSCTAAPLLEAVAVAATSASEADLSLAGLTSAGHVIRDPTGEEFAILRDSTFAVTLRCRGCLLARTSVNLLLQNRLSAPDAHARAVAHLAELLLRPTIDPNSTRTRLLLRDSLIAIDGKCLGASYRDIAIAIYGFERVRAEWVGPSRWMKDHVRRLYARGEELRDGGFRDLLHRGVV